MQQPHHHSRAATGVGFGRHGAYLLAVAKGIGDVFARFKQHMAVLAPWFSDLFAENRALLGEDSWPCGLDANRKAVDTFPRYLGQVKRPVGQADFDRIRQLDQSRDWPKRSRAPSAQTLRKAMRELDTPSNRTE